MRATRFFSKQISLETSLKILISAGLIGIGTKGFANPPIGVMGGSNVDGSSYAALVSSNANLTTISNLPGSTSEIFGVSINNGGTALIGGTNNGEEYATLVSPNGTLIPLQGSLSLGAIVSTSINKTGHGLIGGGQSFTTGDAALIAPDGTITSLSLPDSPIFINSVALNDSDVGLIGGEGVDANTYAAFVSKDGTVTLIPDVPTTGIGSIDDVAINQKGNGIIGGFVESGLYAALVYPTQSLVLLSPLPSGGGNLAGVAINNSGSGLIGGEDNNGNAYVGSVSPDGTVTPLFTSLFPGLIQSTSLNDSGTGLIGGSNNSNLYAALIQPNGTITSLNTGTIAGLINSVSLNQAGVGLLGGRQGSAAYAALMAPNGTLTILDVSGQNFISSVDLSSGIADAAIPQSIGPFSSVFYTQLAASFAIDSRFNAPNRICDCREERSAIKNTIWSAPFGNYVQISSRDSIPRYSNLIGGALIGVDHQTSKYLIGACIGYAYNEIHLSHRLGHGNIQEEMIGIYGAFYKDHLTLNGAIWGGLTQFHNSRHTIVAFTPEITSKARTNGWTLTPHLELASPWAIDVKGRTFFEPFVSLDWVNGWQRHYTERGSAGFNLRMKDVYGSLLQSEAGIHFYQLYQSLWADIFFEETFSFVNQAPFHLNPVTTSFVGSLSTFSVAIGDTRVENLGAAEVSVYFVPKNRSNLYGGLAGKVMANNNYNSYFVTLFAGADF